MNQTLIWLLVSPLLVGLICAYLYRGRPEVWPVVAGVTFGLFFLTLAGFYGAKASATSDVEIINGEVVSKSREHGTYEQPYTCNCVTTYDSKGNASTVCQTCYETHYTVDWFTATTVGKIDLYSEDSTWRSVYNTPDPAFYVNIRPGDPVAQRHSYTNYIQAVPNSLFTASSKTLKERFALLIPPYPDKVYDFYSVDRVLTPGYSLPDIKTWNLELANSLRKLGPAKQANSIIVIAKTDDPNYEYALRDAWENANKNDVVLIVGSKNWPNIDFVRVISWTKNELFKVELRDAVQAMGTVNHGIVKVLEAQIAKNFSRRHMKEFEYLDDEIAPPTWVINSLAVLQLLGFIGLYVYVNMSNPPKLFRTSRRF